MEESQQRQRYGLEKRGMARSSQASPFLLSSFLLIVLPLCRTLPEAGRCNLQGPISSLYDTELSKGRVTNGSEVSGFSASIAQYWKWGRRIQGLVHSGPSKIPDFRIASGRDWNFGSMT